MYAYYTVENARRSTGLGLYIAKTLTKRMGGDIRAEYGGGMLETTVSFPGVIKYPRMYKNGCGGSNSPAAALLLFLPLFHSLGVKSKSSPPYAFLSILMCGGLSPAHAGSLAAFSAHLS